jgi:hypothetical protein
MSAQLVYGEQTSTVVQPSNVQMSFRHLVLGQFWKRTEHVRALDNFFHSI